MGDMMMMPTLAPSVFLLHQISISKELRRYLALETHPGSNFAMPDLNDGRPRNWQWPALLSIFAIDIGVRTLLALKPIFQSGLS